MSAPNSWQEDSLGFYNELSIFFSFMLHCYWVAREFERYQVSDESSTWYIDSSLESVFSEFIVTI